MKNFGIIGLGNFGSTVVNELSDLNCNVTAIDNDKARVQSAKDFADTAIVADATNKSILENIGVGQFDCFIVSTGKDSHASILIALHLSELGAKEIIIKANSEDHAKILKKVGATQVVIPEQQMATHLAQNLAKPNMLDFLPLTDEYFVAEVAAPDHFVGKKLAELQLRNKFNVQVMAVKKPKTNEFNFVPGGESVIRDSDIMVVLGKEEDINKIRE